LTVGAGALTLAQLHGTILARQHAHARLLHRCDRLKLATACEGLRVLFISQLGRLKWTSDSDLAGSFLQH
jgi:hypothetical protein